MSFPDFVLSGILALASNEPKSFDGDEYFPDTQRKYIIIKSQRNSLESEP